VSFGPAAPLLVTFLCQALFLNLDLVASSASAAITGIAIAQLAVKWNSTDKLLVIVMR
jgi:hypothetical protein